VPNDVINDLELITRDIEPIKMLFPHWNNYNEAREKRVVDLDSWIRGALHIWRESIPGRDYIIGVDAAEGMGEENDNSCIEIIDAATCEQVAEFYSNLCPPHNFAQVVMMLGRMYNNALIIVESQSAGLTVLDKLKHEFSYENLFESTNENTGKSSSPGIKTNRSTRPKFLETIQTRLINQSIAIRSRRFIKELKGFIWNSATKRAEATRGFHDDAIMAMCFALHARDIQYRQNPVGINTSEDFKEKFKTEIYEDIKKELAKISPEEWVDPDDLFLFGPKVEEAPTIMAGYERKLDKLLAEFGWAIFLAIWFANNSNMA